MLLFPFIKLTKAAPILGVESQSSLLSELTLLSILSSTFVSALFTVLFPIWHLTKANNKKKTRRENFIAVCRWDYELNWMIWWKVLWVFILIQMRGSYIVDMVKQIKCKIHYLCKCIILRGSRTLKFRNRLASLANPQILNNVVV